MDYLRFLNNPESDEGDEALANVLNVPNRYINRKFIQDLEHFSMERDCHLYQGLKSMPIDLPYIRDNVAEMIGIIDPLIKDVKNLVPSEVIQILRDSLNYDAFIANDDVPAPDDSKIQNINQLQMASTRYRDISSFLSYEEGISILLANSDAEATRYWHQYIKGKLDTILPPLKNKDLRKIMLSLFASGLCKDQTGIHTFLLSTYTGFLHWNKNSGTRDAFLNVIIKNCSFLKRYKLLDEGENGSLYTTQIRTLCAISGVEVESFVLLQKTLEKIDPTDWDHWEIIFPCLHCQELADLIRIYIRISNPWEIWRVSENLNPKNYEILLDWSKSILRTSNDVVKRVQTFLILDDWINGLEMNKIENKYTTGNNDQILSGTIRNIAETSAWIIQTLCRIAYVLNYDIDFIAYIGSGFLYHCINKFKFSLLL